MKKLLVLGGAGIAAAGVAYALKSSRKEQESKQEGIDTGNTAGTLLNESATATEKAMGTSPKEFDEQLVDNQTALDDGGTTPEMAARIVRTVRDGAFDGSDERLALALGRPTEEITAWMNGLGPVDSDALIKTRALGQERNVETP